jgi:hypothetical protein
MSKRFILFAVCIFIFAVTVDFLIKYFNLGIGSCSPYAPSEWYCEMIKKRRVITLIVLVIAVLWILFSVVKEVRRNKKDR